VAKRFFWAFFAPTEDIRFFKQEAGNFIDYRQSVDSCFPDRCRAASSQCIALVFACIGSLGEKTVFALLPAFFCAVYPLAIAPPL